MSDLFDFNSDGKTSLIEKVVGIELINNVYRLKAATTVNNQSAMTVLNGGIYVEFDEDDEVLDDDDDFHTEVKTCL